MFDGVSINGLYFYWPNILKADDPIEYVKKDLEKQDERANDF